jgi:hypothetical protein
MHDLFSGDRAVGCGLPRLRNLVHHADGIRAKARDSIVVFSRVVNDNFCKVADFLVLREMTETTMYIQCPADAAPLVLSGPATDHLPLFLK